MTLADLRKLAIRKQLKIHFRLANGMECVVNEHGVAQVPEWRGIPDFNLEEELASAAEFLLEPAGATDPKHPVKPRTVARGELAALTTVGAAAAGAEHEEE
ncbi:MAG: hypothetical protein LAP87_06180 [Acidobacteriia bacterium]|nr:hypothetical protein [Terriglobia bacterium]